MSSLDGISKRMRIFFPCDDTLFIRPLRFLSLEHSNYILSPESIAVFMDVWTKCVINVISLFSVASLCEIAHLHSCTELMSR